MCAQLWVKRNWLISHQLNHCMFHLNNSLISYETKAVLLSTPEPKTSYLLHMSSPLSSKCSTLTVSMKKHLALYHIHLGSWFCLGAYVKYRNFWIRCSCFFCGILWQTFGFLQLPILYSCNACFILEISTLNSLCYIDLHLYRFAQSRAYILMSHNYCSAFAQLFTVMMLVSFSNYSSILTPFMSQMSLSFLQFGAGIARCVVWVCSAALLAILILRSPFFILTDERDSLFPNLQRSFFSFHEYNYHQDLPEGIFSFEILFLVRAFPQFHDRSISFFVKLHSGAPIIFSTNFDHIFPGQTIHLSYSNIDPNS